MAWRQVETGLHLLQNTRKFGATVLFLAMLATGQLGACLVRPAVAQSYGAELGFLSLPVETVTVAIANPRSDQAFNDRVTDGFRRFLAVYPGDRFSENAAAYAIARVRRNPDIADVTYSYALGRAGGLDVTFTITLAADGSTFSGRGYLITNNMADLPVLYDRDGTYVRAKLEALSLYYGNNNAWYGQPDAMLAGNPLVEGKPAGSGYSDWAEGYLHYGLYGITPLSDNFYVYGGLSSISSGSMAGPLNPLFAVAAGQKRVPALKSLGIRVVSQEIAQAIADRWRPWLVNKAVTGLAIGSTRNSSHNVRTDLEGNCGKT